MLGLYIHIPFCKTICSYCDFNKQVLFSNIEDIYINRLLEEIDSKQDILKNISSVYIGGGTPNAISISNLKKLLDKIKPYLLSSTENTIELNPELVTEELIHLLYMYNINRISLGVQTINLNLIKLLNRHHTKDIVIKSYNIIKKYIKNINIDLMFGIPFQTYDDINNDIELIKILNPTHISYYSLILEDKTILSYKYNQGKIKLLDDDIIADMYDYINTNLKKLNYIHYETSNYAKNGYESKHNMLYWTMKEYIGLGSSACSYYKKQRITNNYSINKYLNNYILSIENINTLEKRNEFMFLGLRMLEGIDLLQYNKLFNSSPIIDYKLDDLIKNNILEIKDNKLRIKENKIFVSNQILIRFVGENNEED